MASTLETYHAAVVVIDEVISGQRLYYQERPDLRFSVRGASFTELRKRATVHLKEVGLEILSINIENEQRLRAIIRSEQRPDAVSRPGTVFRPTSPVKMPLTASGRRRG
jgi:hypothetical protein